VEDVLPASLVQLTLFKEKQVSLVKHLKLPSSCVVRWKFTH